jgi:hypothetical protein
MPETLSKNSHRVVLDCFLPLWFLLCHERMSGPGLGAGQPAPGHARDEAQGQVGPGLGPQALVRPRGPDPGSRLLVPPATACHKVSKGLGGMLRFRGKGL